MSVEYFVDTSERKTVDVLDKMRINYKLTNNALWFCDDCAKIYKESVSECSECGSKNISFEKVGDIRGPNWEYAIEIKIGEDLYSSLDDRIYLQLEGLSEFLEGNIAIVYIGDISELALNHPERAGQIMSIPATAMQYGVSFISVKDITEFIKMLKYFAEKAGKLPKLRFRRRYITDLMPKMMIVLMGIKGIGEKMALELNKHYSSVFALCLALHTGELREGIIKGVGPATITLLKRYLLNVRG
jgi:ERCC4-type nuclease